MNNNKKNFDIYVFFSTFARNLIEAFIGTILYKKGFTLHEVLLYYLLVNIFSFILAFLCIIISKKYSNKILSIISLISFILLQVFLSNLTLNIKYLYLLSFLFALYRRSYWMSRRYYTLKVINKVDISKKYSIISILNQLAVIIGTYIGAILLDFISIKALTIISIFPYILNYMELNI